MTTTQFIWNVLGVLFIGFLVIPFYVFLVARMWTIGKLTAQLKFMEDNHRGKKK